jgi:transposase
MTEVERLEIVRRFHQGASFRVSARALGIDHKTVASVIHAYQRNRDTPQSALRRPRTRRSQLDAYANQIGTLLERYPDSTAVRLDEELRAKGFTGGHAIVKDWLRRLRPKPTRSPVVRFERARASRRKWTTRRSRSPSPRKRRAASRPSATFSATRAGAISASSSHRIL